ncbi:hypothetical protein EDB83DRAFT_260857 [Lactarius deliciosus]|nr:hypothetical protein EDB83DRAFT_260857 [Lactarius deliciosus]
MVSQRGLFAFVPGVRSEAARAAAKSPTSPVERAMYFAQEAMPQLACDRVLAEAIPAKRPQAPVPAVEARAAAAPSKIAHKVPNPARVVTPSTRNIGHVASVPSRLSFSVHSSPRAVSPSVPKSSSTRPSIPEHPQAAQRAFRTSFAIQSRPRWPQRHPSHQAPRPRAICIQSVHAPSHAELSPATNSPRRATFQWRRDYHSTHTSLQMRHAEHARCQHDSHPATPRPSRPPACVCASSHSPVTMRSPKLTGDSQFFSEEEN